MALAVFVSASVLHGMNFKKAEVKYTVKKTERGHDHYIEVLNSSESERRLATIKMIEFSELKIATINEKNYREYISGISDEAFAQLEQDLIKEFKKKYSTLEERIWSVGLQTNFNYHDVSKHKIYFNLLCQLINQVKKEKIEQKELVTSMSKIGQLSSQKIAEILKVSIDEVGQILEG